MYKIKIKYNIENKINFLFISKFFEFCVIYIEDFKQILIECLEPKELLRYYKAYNLASYTCRVLIKQYYAAIYYANKALQIYDVVENSNFFDQLYGNDSRNYKELLKSNINISRIYQYLSVSNKEIVEEKEKCAKKLEFKIFEF